MNKITIFWFRRDLRLSDNTALFFALQSEFPVLPIFIFDTVILNKLSDKKDARVSFIYNTLKSLNADIQKHSSALLAEYGTPLEVFKKLHNQYTIHTVYTNHDYEPYALNRDKEIKLFLEAKGIDFTTYKDQVIVEKDELLNDSGQPYKVYTAYRNKWRRKFASEQLKEYKTEKLFHNFYKTSPIPFPSLKSLGFKESDIAIPSSKIDLKKLKEYHLLRNTPEPNHTSLLGIHLRFGTISIRHIVQQAAATNDTWLDELIWREFFMQLLYHFPYVADKPFQPKFNNFPWKYDEKAFEKWCKGETGYPLVDAGMRQLNQTGFMHNRVRMVTASFLAKDLLIDWRWGEAYFAEKLLDYELASNNGNWQWAAGTGADAQPFIRIFNPTTQQEKFDPDFLYIKKWLPEYGTKAYPAPMVDHKLASQKAKETFLKYREHYT